MRPLYLSFFALAATLGSAETASAHLSPDAHRDLTFICMHCI
jgi:hypothetical protein